MSEDRIEEFRREYEFLSNFYPSPVTYNGVTYPTSEHAYQAAKATSKRDHDKILYAKRPGDAKRIGKHIPRNKAMIRDEGRIRVMREVVQAKFEQNPDLAEKLLATEEAKLIEGNTWGDQFWGAVNGRGDNHLGRILMDVRRILREKK